jgi:hypothetical protein
LAGKPAGLSAPIPWYQAVKAGLKNEEAILQALFTQNGNGKSVV